MCLGTEELDLNNYSNLGSKRQRLDTKKVRYIQSQRSADFIWQKNKFPSAEKSNDSKTSGAEFGGKVFLML